MDLKSYIDGLRTGTPESSGTFTLDPRAGRERWGELVAQQPVLPLLRLIQTCIRAQASYLEIHVYPRGLRFTAEGLGQPPEQWVESSTHPTHQRWRESRMLLQALAGSSTLIVRFHDGRRLTLEGQQALWSEAGPGQPDIELVVMWSQDLGPTLRAEFHRELSRRLTFCPIPIRLDAQPLCSGTPERILKPVQPTTSLGEAAGSFAWLSEQTRLAPRGFGMAPMVARPPAEYAAEGTRHRLTGHTSLLHFVEGPLGRLQPLVENPQRKHADQALQGNAWLLAFGAFCFIHPVAWVVGPAGVVRHFYYRHKQRTQPRYLDPPKNACLFPGHQAEVPIDCLTPLLYSWDLHSARGWKVSSWCALPILPGGPNLLYAVHDGVLLEPVELSGRPLGGRCVRHFDELKTDLSGLKAVQSEELAEAEQSAQEQFEQLLTQSQDALSPQNAERARLALSAREAWRKVVPRR